MDNGAIAEGKLVEGAEALMHGVVPEVGGWPARQAVQEVRPSLTLEVTVYLGQI